MKIIERYSIQDGETEIPLELKIVSLVADIGDNSPATVELSKIRDKELKASVEAYLKRKHSGSI